MIDTILLMRQWLLTCSTLIALLSDRDGTKSIYCGDLPEGVDPAQGPAIQLYIRGGTVHNDAPIVTASIQIRVWAGKNQGLLARRVYGVLHDNIHGKNNIAVGSYGTVMACLCEVLGQDVTDPDTSWATVASFYELQARA